MRDEFRALPPTAAAVTALEQLVDKHAGHRSCSTTFSLRRIADAR